VSFHVAGTVVAISGSMLYFIPLVQRCLGRKNPNGQTVELNYINQEDGPTQDRNKQEVLSINSA